MLLDLGGECTAVVLPAGLTQAVTAILAGRDRRAPVLVNPGAPQERTLVAGEPYGVPLPWPGGVRLVTGALALPPSTTRAGRCAGSSCPPTRVWLGVGKSTSSVRCTPRCTPPMPRVSAGNEPRWRCAPGCAGRVGAHGRQVRDPLATRGTVAYVLGAQQMGDHGMAGVLDSIPVSPSGWTDLAEVRLVGQRWLHQQRNQQSA